MKIRVAVMLCIVTVVLGGCARENEGASVDYPIPESYEDEDEVEIPADDIEDYTEDFEDSVNENVEKNVDYVEGNVNYDEDVAEEKFPDEAAYIGEYLDYDVSEPNLEIAKGEDGKYIVQIGIFRLTTLDDGVGEMTAEGMTFTATDAAGNPIGGIITVEDDIATVTFTDSTWDLIEHGTVYQYSKASDVPNVWGE